MHWCAMASKGLPTQYSASNSGDDGRSDAVTRLRLLRARVCFATALLETAIVMLDEQRRRLQHK